MKKHTVVLLICSFAIAILYLAIVYIKPLIIPAQNGSVRIAVLTPTTHPALEEIEQGFKETMQRGGEQYSFTIFNANGNRTLLRAQAEEIVQANFNLIFTIGAGATQTIAELLSKKGIKTPHVFGGVDGPAFAESVAVINPTSTGVYVKEDYNKEIDLVNMLKPNIKNMLLVYDPTHGTGQEKYKHEIEEYIKKYNTKLHSVEIYQTNEIQQKVAALLQHMDAVLVLTDNTVVAGIDALVTLCNRYGVTLVASDLASGKKGAAIAYGITEYESGSGAAQKAAEIIEHHKEPQQLPISAVTNFRIAINRETMHLQNLKLDELALKKYEEQQ